MDLLDLAIFVYIMLVIPLTVRFLYRFACGYERNERGRR